ncbi:MAG: T9SS type A sorting domain-containing protein [Candidatus Cloacimonadales bacterium]|jgi:hypothetical protein|nr:T9SS type A sorting domain-containing protein [Candidatus Cloacimonadota bacterium]MDD3501678.1 T9SS type A sorting domain-containing protein [Candidatus Cloacimonadota bacterium]MDX9978190.1 T9SS type A sorting domain-containing protein [Candidatus Cloacimonadales bacterium]
MKKNLIILLFLCVFALNYAYEDFLADKRVTLTPEEKEEYYKRINDDPSENSFMPLNIGNAWVFKFMFNGAETTYQLSKVADSTLVDNNVFYEISYINNINQWYHWSWLRNEGDTLIYWDENDNIQGPETEFLIDQDFSINENSGTSLENPIYVYNSFQNNFDMGNYFKCHFVEQGFVSVWGVVTEYKVFYYRHATIVDQHNALMWARGYGLIYMENEWGEGFLLGSIINGNALGDISALSNETPPIAISEIEVSSYPNPFRSNTQIKYQLPGNTHNGSLEIYNVKGQLIKKENIFNSGTYNWDAKDQQGNAVASGIYFINIKTNQTSTVKKTILIK